MTLFSLALRNLTGRPIRTGAMVFGLGVLSMFIFLVLTLYFSMDRAIEMGRSRIGADAIILPKSLSSPPGGIILSGVPVARYMDKSILEKVRLMDSVKEASAQLFLKSAPLPCCSVSDTVLVGYDPEMDFTIAPWLRENLDHTIEQDEIIAGSNILSEIGGRIQFYGKVFRIVGKLESTGMEFFDSSVFVPMQGAREMINSSEENSDTRLEILPDEISSVLISFSDLVEHESAAVLIQYELPEVNVILASEAMRSARNVLRAPVRILALAVLLQWITVIILIAVLYGITVQERIREVGLLKSLGARASVVSKMFLMEAVFLSVASSIFGVSAGAFVVIFFGEVLLKIYGSDILGIQFNYIALAVAVIIPILTSVVTVLVPAIRASGIDPFNQIRS